MPHSILIVDDYPANLKLAEVLLITKDCAVRIAKPIDRHFGAEVVRYLQTPTTMAKA